jgi:hypothetical protein
MENLVVTVPKLNKRKVIPARLPDTNNIAGVVFKNFSFAGEEVSGGEIPNPSLGSWFKDADGFFYWAGGLSLASLPAATGISTPSILAPPVSVPHELPLNRTQCLKAAGWLKQNFEEKINNAVKDTPFDKELIYAIACQETAFKWLLWIDKDKFSAATILERCVFDASGDFPDTHRSAFPRNKKALLDEFGPEITQMLVDEGNKMRAMPQPGSPDGWSKADFLYKGYGIFQYDLQFIKEDKKFFTEKGWASIDECIKRALKELKTKFSQTGGNMFKTVKAYNGSGDRAEHYAQNVSQFYTWIKAVS